MSVENIPAMPEIRTIQDLHRLPLDYAFPQPPPQILSDAQVQELAYWQKRYPGYVFQHNPGAVKWPAECYCLMCSKVARAGYDLFHPQNTIRHWFR